MASLFTPAQAFTQDTRHLRITTSLEPDALLVRSVRGMEAMSQLFQFEVDLLSHSGTINPQDVVGDNVCITIEPDPHSAPRLLNGFIKRFQYAGLEGRGLYHYRAEVVPWLWFLGKRTDCRVFQNQSIPEIIKSLFEELGFPDYNFALVAEYPPLEYCVQYNESDLDFVHRLLEHAGIYYYFEHQQDKHLLHLCDDSSHYTTLDPARLLHTSGSREERHIHLWQHSYQYCSGAYAQTDYDFEKANHALLTETATTLRLKKNAAYPRFAYPGLYTETDQGRTITRVRMQQEEVGYEQVRAAANIHTLAIGKKFVLNSDENLTDHGQAFVITELHHAAYNPSFRQGEDEGNVYSNQFSCLPAATTFRPLLITPKPRMEGVQTAVVVGKSGDEIYTDKYGRIKVQFHWDRYGEKNEESSCWVRVATQWAGSKWGTIGIPRVGQEVVVTFVDGNPDKPLVIGSVYNSAHMPPYGLPDNKTMTGLKSRSSKGGDPSMYNEIVIDDKKGAEQVRINAHKDFNMNVGNNAGLNTVGNSTANVDGNSSSTVGGNSSSSVGGNTSHSTGGDDSHNVAGNRTATVSGNESLSVTGNQDRSVGGNLDGSIAGKASLSVGSDQAVQVGGKQNLTVASDQTVSVGAHQEMKITSNQTLDIGAEQMITADAQTVKIANAASLQAASISQSGKQSIDLVVGASSIAIGKDSITLSMGASSVKIDASGVTVMGPTIKLN